MDKLDQETVERICMAVGAPVPLDPKYLAACAELSIAHEMSVKGVVQAAIALYQMKSVLHSKGYHMRFINEYGEDWDEPFGCGLAE
jgi:hypothetical protein